MSIVLKGSRTDKPRNELFFNSEGYFDGTAGEAILNLIREERERNRKYVINSTRTTIWHFVRWFTEDYAIYHGRFTPNGKLRNLANPKKVERWLSMYLFCINNCDKEWFTVEMACKRFNTSERIIQQCFEQRGDLWRVAEGYLRFMEDVND